MSTAIVIVIVVVVIGALIVGTALMAGVVFLWASSFENTSSGSIENLDIRCVLDSDNIQVGSGTYSCLIVTVIEGPVIWSDYTVTVDDIEVHDVHTLNSPPDNTNREVTESGGEAYFTHHDWGSEPERLSPGSEHVVKFIKISDNSLKFKVTLTVVN